LAEGSILTDDFLRELMNVGEVDILIGVPTFNDAKTVGQVVQAIRAGLLKYFPRHRSVIINADGGSKDGTQDLVRAASISDLQHVSNVSALRTLHCISTQYPGVTNVEVSRKDTTRLQGDEDLTTFSRFRDFVGDYPIHCHNTVHEDHAMMLLFQVQPNVIDNNQNP